VRVKGCKGWGVDRAELCLFLRKNNKHHTIIHGIALRGFALSAVVVHGRIGVGLKGVHPPSCPTWHALQQ
jgi:hypothetical protein